MLEKRTSWRIALMIFRGSQFGVAQNLLAVYQLSSIGVVCVNTNCQEPNACEKVSPIADASGARSSTRIAFRGIPRTDGAPLRCTFECLCATLRDLLFALTWYANIVSALCDSLRPVRIVTSLLNLSRRRACRFISRSAEKVAPRSRSRRYTFALCWLDT